jgi:hypothetical protein
MRTYRLAGIRSLGDLRQPIGNVERCCCDARNRGSSGVNRTRCNATHGHTRQIGGRGGKVWKSLTYQSWSSMNDRCYGERHKWFDAYGGRGITVCTRWRRGEPDAFANFLADMGERPSKELTLDRIDVNGNYELHKPDGKLQCKWATKSEQRINQRAAAQHGQPSQGRDAGRDSERVGDIPY